MHDKPYCEYGAISIGDRTFVNVDAVVLDVAPVTIGAACQIATRVQLLTATHRSTLARVGEQDRVEVPAI